MTTTLESGLVHQDCELVVLHAGWPVQTAPDLWFLVFTLSVCQLILLLLELVTFKNQRYQIDKMCISVATTRLNDNVEIHHRIFISARAVCVCVCVCVCVRARARWRDGVEGRGAAFKAGIIV